MTNTPRGDSALPHNVTATHTHTLCGGEHEWNQAGGTNTVEIGYYDYHGTMGK